MKSHWIEHKGKRVFLAEYSHFGTDSVALKQEANEMIAHLAREPLNSVCSISNVAGTTASMANIQILMDVLTHTNKIVTKRCVIGASGLGWQLIPTFNRIAARAQFRPFRTLEEALDWIVAE